MANVPYKNIKRFIANLSTEVSEKMESDGLPVTVLEASDTVDLFGKKASELTNNFKVEGNVITADLPYVTDYTGFSSKPEEQQGNYLAFSVDTDLKDATIKVKTSKGTYTLDEDKTIVLIVNGNPTITVSAKNDTAEISKKFTTNLTLEPAPNTEE